MKLSKMLVFLLSILLIGLLAVGCGGPTPPSENGVSDENDVNEEEQAAPSEKEVYTGEAEGGWGPVIVEVTLDGDKIVNIEVVEQNETEGLGDTAIDELIPKIIEAQSTDGIDVVSGATASSNALIGAVNEALSKAN